MTSKYIQNLFVQLLIGYSNLVRNKKVKDAFFGFFLVLYLLIPIPIFIFVTDSFNEEYAHATVQILVTTLLVFFSIFLAIYPSKEIKLEERLHGDLGKLYEKKARKLLPVVRKHKPSITIERTESDDDDEDEKPLKPFQDEMLKFAFKSIRIYAVGLFIVLLVVFLAFFNGLYSQSKDAFFFAYFYALLFYIVVVIWMIYTVVNVHFRYALLAYIIPNKLLTKEVVKALLIIADVFVDYDEGVVGQYVQDQLGKKGIKRKGRKKYEVDGDEVFKVR
jgi:hypothetical protein